MSARTAGGQRANLATGGVLDYLRSVTGRGPDPLPEAHFGARPARDPAEPQTLEADPHPGTHIAMGPSRKPPLEAASPEEPLPSRRATGNEPRRPA